MSYVLAVGSSVVFQPHTINMSLWWGRGAPETLTCGGAALTAIDKEVRRILGMECPGGKSFIGGRLMMSLEDVIASFLSASRFLLKHVISSLHTLTNQPVSPLFTDLRQGQKCI